MQLLLLVAMLAQSPIQISDRQFYRAPIVAPRVEIVGSGCNGTDPTGPILCFDPGVRDGITLGAGDPFRATGSRISGTRVARYASGGTAIKIAALNEGERPGEIVLRDILVCGMSDLAGGDAKDNWDTALLIDGGNLTATGAAGVRRIRIDNFRAASCLGDSIVLRNVTHLTGTAIQIDKGTSPRPVPTMVVEKSRHVNISVNLFGELHIRNSDVVTVSGYVQTLRVDRLSTNVVVSGVVGQYVPERGGSYVNTWGMVVQKTK